MSLRECSGLSFDAFIRIKECREIKNKKAKHFNILLSL